MSVLYKAHTPILKDVQYTQVYNSTEMYNVQRCTYTEVYYVQRCSMFHCS